jgi:flavin reductase (DIM6/NTAB) family NADH-FMN oxidoreductase RutF
MGTPAAGGDPGPPPSVDLQTFRFVMGSFASGVCVVTTADEAGVPRGLTCSAVCSVSVDPPLLLASVASRSGTLAAIVRTGRFGVNMLGSQGRSVSQLFASGADDKFERVRWQRGPATGAPVLAATVAHAECVVHATVPAGDHTLVVGRMVSGSTDQERAPLTYFRGGYAQLLRAATLVDFTEWTE